MSEPNNPPGPEGAEGAIDAATQEAENPNCGARIYYYSSKTNVESIGVLRNQSTSETFRTLYQTFPAGAYASGIAPIDPEWTQSSLSAHFYGQHKPRRKLVCQVLCQQEHFYSPPGFPQERAPFVPERIGVNPMPL